MQRNFFMAQILTSYDRYVGEESSEEDKEPAGFWTRIKGSFFMFSGYLGNPTIRIHGSDHPPKGTLVFPDKDNKFENHFGLYDVFTLGIPYALEAFFRGNWISGSRSKQNFFQGLFTIIPIVPALATIRNGFGLIATVFSSPVIFGDYLHDHYQFAKAKEKDARQIAMEKESVTAFTDQYKKLKLALGKQSKKKEGEGFQQETFIVKKPEVNPQEAGSTLTAIKETLKTVPAIAQTEGVLFQTKTKIGRQVAKVSEGGKYDKMVKGLAHSS